MIDQLYRGRDWWPMCAVCKQPVGNVESVPLKASDGIRERAIRRYIVTCHGQTEETVVGIWAAWEIVQQHKRLPDAFKQT